MSNIEYLLISGVLIAGGLAFFDMVLRALVAAMSIKTLIYALPVG